MRSGSLTRYCPRGRDEDLGQRFQNRVIDAEGMQGGVEGMVGVEQDEVAERCDGDTDFEPATTRQGVTPGCCASPEPGAAAGDTGKENGQGHRFGLCRTAEQRAELPDPWHLIDRGSCAGRKEQEQDDQPRWHGTSCTGETAQWSNEERSQRLFKRRLRCS